MAFTKVVGPGIHTLSNITSHNIHSSGIITAISFVGDGSGLTGVASTDSIITGTAATFTGGVDINSDLDVDGHTNLDNVSIAGVTTFAGGLTGTTANFSGDVTVGGVLTYEDVKNVDSVGLITARNGINVSGGNVSIAGDIDVDGHTNLDNVSIAGVVTATDLTVEKTGNLNVNIKSTSGWGALEVGGATAGYIDIKKPFSDDYDLRFMVDGSGTNYITSNAAPLKLNAQGATGIELGAYGAPSLKYNNDTKLTTTIKGIQVGTGVTIETNGQATYTGIITATAFKLADGSAIGAGAGGTWSTYTAGIATTKSVGVNTSNLDDNDLVGVGNSFQGLYISNGMLIHDNTLNGNHYIGTSMSGLMAGPVNIEGTLTIDGNYVVV